MIKNTKKSYILIFLSVILAVFLFAGCSKAPSLEERGFTVVITYDFAGGKVDNYGQKTLYYKPGSPVIEPSKDIDKFKPPVRSMKYVSHWVYAQTDESGAVILDTEGNAVAGERVVDFATFTAAENVTIVAVWADNSIFTIMMPAPYEKDAEGNEVRSIEYAVEENRTLTLAGMRGSVKEEIAKVLGADYTATHGVIDFWWDEDCTAERFAFPFTTPEKGAEIKYTLYSRIREGNWDVIETASDVRNMTKNGAALGKNYILYNDIDMSVDGAPGAWPTITVFNGIFDGDGHTVSNIDTVSETKTASDDAYGLFKRINTTGVIQNVTFENVSISCESAFLNIVRVGVLAGQMTGSVRDCTFINCSIEMTRKNALTVFAYQADNPAYRGIFGSNTEPVLWENVTIEDGVTVTQHDDF